MKRIMFSAAIEGFRLSMGARRLSVHTVADYNNTLRKFSTWLGEDRAAADITSKDVEMFMASLDGLSTKTMSNYHVGLSAMWSWMEGEGIVKQNIMRKLKPPRVERKEVTPFTQEEVKALFGALERSRLYRRSGVSMDHALGTFERNRAIMLLLLDTGIRASELCDLKLEDLDNRNNRIFVRMGKGMKERLLPFSPRTGQMIWRYLATRGDVQPGDYLFVSNNGHPMSRVKLYEILDRAGKRAGIPHVHPHRFRHTFAIQYLRNGGNAYTLQAMLGHSTLETVRIYLQLAQVDLDQVHKKASPVDNWRL